MIDYRIDRRATLARGVVPGAFTVIEAGAIVEEEVTIGVGCYIGAGVRIGKGAVLGVHAVALANVPAGAYIPPGVVWDDALLYTANGVLQTSTPAALNLSADIPTPAHRGRPRKAVRA